MSLAPQNPLPSFNESKFRRMPEAEINLEDELIPGAVPITEFRRRDLRSTGLIGM
jgi:hypothetical protein